MMSFHVTARRIDVHGSLARCKDAELILDTDLQGRPDAFDPAELLLAALAACMINGIERVTPILKFQLRGIEVSVRGLRQDTPPRLESIEYEIIVDTDESDRRLALLHDNVKRYGTVFNTVAPGARAVNDTPKLTALLLAAQVMSPHWSSVLIAAVMVAGGLLFARRVAETMSKRVTRMDHTQGVAANLITSSLVSAASLFALPVSTTHVAVGAIAGVGTDNGLQWETLRHVLLSWIATLPLAAVLAGATFQLLGALA